jgi:hypothetical protein
MKLGLIAILVLLMTQADAMGDNCQLWIDATTIESGQGFERWMYVKNEGCDMIPIDLAGNVTVEIREKDSNFLMYAGQEPKSYRNFLPTRSGNLKFDLHYIPFSNLTLPAKDKDYIYIVIETTYNSNHGVLKDKETRIFEVS